jgi:hypothetical protein
MAVATRRACVVICDGDVSDFLHSAAAHCWHGALGGKLLFWRPGESLCLPSRLSNGDPKIARARLRAAANISRSRKTVPQQRRAHA